jgi:hypothetical protein
MNINKVEGHPNYVRDDATKAVINTNYNEYKNYILAREAKIKEQERLSNIEMEIDEIKQSIKSIMEMLKNEPR